MRCSLCGAENSEERTTCSLCDSSLENERDDDLSSEDESFVYLDPVDASSFQVHWQKLGIFLIIVAFLAMPWLLMSDLFKVPEDVQKTRNSYEKVFTSYHSQRELWNQRKNQLLLNMDQHQQNPDLSKQPMKVGDLPLEVLFAYLHDNLDLFSRNQSDLAIFPMLKKGERPWITLSKYESGIWPLKIMLSLDVELATEGVKVTPKVLRMRRGNRDIPGSLAWVYFGPELQTLRQLESVKSGMFDLMIYEKTLYESSHSASNIHFSWKYLPSQKQL